MAHVPALRVLAIVVSGLMIAACGRSSSSPSGEQHGQIVAVGAENEYAEVISQIGGRYVKVSAIMSNPNTDPHTFEASPSVAQTVGHAKLVVQNGVGYDDFMTKIESASPSTSRKVIDVQKLLGVPDSTPNPHLWYKPAHDAGRGRRAGRATFPRCSPPTRPTSGPTGGASTRHYSHGSTR